MKVNIVCFKRFIFTSVSLVRASQLSHVKWGKTVYFLEISVQNDNGYPLTILSQNKIRYLDAN